MGQINTNNYPTVDSLADADLLIVENAIHGTGTTTPKQLRENAIGTDPLQTTAQTVTGAINEIFEMATDTVVGLELGKMTSFSDDVIVTDIDLHRAPVAGDRILFYHGSSVASPSSLTTYNDGVAVTTAISDFSMTHPAGLTLMKCVALGENLRWQTVQDIADGGYTAGVGISINGTTINNSAPQLGDDIAYSRVDTVTSGALGYFSADADCLVMDFRTDAEPYNGGYTLRLTTTGASFKYATLKDKAGNPYAEEIPSGSLVLCKSNVSGTGSEADPVVVTVLEIGNVEMAHDVEVLKDICITEKTASGNPLTLTDALPYAALSLSADIEPIQDLHGLPFPYVGGAYKNKLPMSISKIKIINVDGTWDGNEYTNNGKKYTLIPDESGEYYNEIKISGTASARSVFYLYRNDFGYDAPIPNTASQTVTWSGFNGVNSLAYKDSSWHTLSPSSAQTTSISSDGIGQLWVDVASGNSDNYTITPQIEIGQTATSYAPYSNICPIGGRTSENINRLGYNLLPPYPYAGPVVSNGLSWTKNSDNTITLGAGKATGGNSSIAKAEGVYLKQGRYKLVGCPSGGSSNTYHILLVPKDTGTWIIDTGNGVVFDKETDGYCDIYYGRVLNNVTVPQLLFKPMITTDLNATYNDYKSYTSIIITIQLGTTVYGGTLNVTTGVLTVDRATDDLGTLDWSKQTAGDVVWFSANVSGIKNISASTDLIKMICSHFKVVTQATWQSNKPCIAKTTGGDAIIFGASDTYASMTKEQFTTAMDGVQLCYELATPVTIQLTPTDLQMLKGYNNISSDAGGDLSITYKADRLAAIEAALAQIGA